MVEQNDVVTHNACQKNCLKQQTQNAMNATLSQNGLGENRFHEVPPFKHN